MRERVDKQIVLKGSFCTLIPVREQDFKCIIRLRNMENNKYFLHQQSDLTLEQQEKWYKDYLDRDDDIYWGIWKDDDTFIGTIRIYNIKGEMCEEGSCIVDEVYSGEAPYAVEAKYLLTEYAFRTLGLKKIVNINKSDNKVMNSLSRQQGFVLAEEIVKDGCRFNYYILEEQNFKKDKIEKILQYWKTR